jgi:PAS domain S-box-containing protein
MLANKAEDSTVLDVVDIACIFKSVTSALTTDELLKKILETSFKITGIQEGSILLNDSNKFTRCIQGSLQESTSDMKVYESDHSFNYEEVPLTIINHVIYTNEELYIEKPYINCDFVEDPYIKIHMPETVLCAPLVARNKVFAILYLEDMSSVLHLSEEKLKLLFLMLSAAALAHENIFLSYGYKLTDKNLGRDKTIIENISEGLCIFHATSTPPYVSFTVWNQPMEDITGYTMEEVNTYGLGVLEKTSHAPYFVDRIIQGEDLLNLECEIARKDDTKRIIIINTRKIRDAFDSLSILVTISDITAQKLMQIELKESDERYKTLFQLSPEAICVHDNGSIILANSAAARLLGIEDKNSLIGQSILDFVHDDYKKLVSKRIHDIRIGSSFEHLCEEKFIKADGSVIEVEVTSAPFPYRGKTYAQVIVRDITGQKEIQRTLKASEERSRLLINMLPDAVYIMRDGRIYFSNKVGASLLGVNDPEDLIGKKRLNFATPMHEDTSQIQNIKDKLAKEGRLSPVEERYLRKLDNSIIDIETIATEFMYKGENSLLVVCRDISERKRSKLLLQQMEETTHMLNQTVEYDKLRTEFFANISHDLRTPINVVLSSLQLFELLLRRSNNIDSVNVSSYIKTMKQNCYRLIRLINNLIDVTKIDAGYFNINLKNCNIVSIVEDITQSIVPYVENKGISLIFDTDIEEKVIACDPDKIERIMLNLISNAFKFTEAKGTIQITLKDLNDHITISVKDSGTGISEDKQHLIFQRFIQVDKSLAREHEGSGIGLSIVKSLVELHGGTITLKSEYGKGSEFLIDLPVRLVSAAPLNTPEDSREILGNVEKISIEFSDIYV